LFKKQESNIINFPYNMNKSHIIIKL